MILSMLVGGWLAAEAIVVPVSPASPLPVAVQQQAQPRPPSPPAKAAAPGDERDAYFQFLMGRQYEMDGDAERAAQALERAAALAPRSAEIAGELSAFYARQNKAREAQEWGNKALAIDPATVTANQVLGMIAASQARVDDEGDRPNDGAAASAAAKAITYLETARKGQTVPDAGLEVLLARLYLRTGAADKAVGTLTRLIQRDPERTDAVALLAQSYERAGKTEEAVKVLRGAAATEPQLYGALGELYENEQRWDEAASAYEKAVTASPRNLELKSRLATALLSSGDTGKAGRAVELLQEVRKGRPSDARTLYLLAEAQRNAGDLDAAEVTARDLIKSAPDAAGGPFVLGRVLGDKQDYQGLVNTVAPWLARHPVEPGRHADIAPMLSQLAQAYLELGKFDDAISAFERAKEADPGNGTYDLYLIRAQASARHYDAAFALAKRIIAAHPKDPRPLRLYADALHQAGRDADAISELKTSLAGRPDDLSAYLSLAEMYGVIGKYREAIAVLDEAIRKFPDDISPVFQKGAMLDREKKPAEAERLFREVLKRDPLNAQALNYLGFMLADRGERLDESVGYIKRALTVEPYNGAYIDSLGWAYFKMNRLDLAEPQLRRAAEQRVRDSAVQDHYADLLFKLGKYEDAVAAWERALAGDGEQVDRAAIDKKIRSARDKAKARR